MTLIYFFTKSVRLPVKKVIELKELPLDFFGM